MRSEWKPVNLTKQAAVEMNEHAIIREAIEELYGPCPVEDFERANEWSEAIDWERVRDAVEEKHPGFHWAGANAEFTDPAEAMVFETRSEMLEDAGRSSLE
jgi:hypothetical protein